MATQLAQYLDISTLRRLRDHDEQKIRALTGKAHKQAALRQYQADLDRINATLAEARFRDPAECVARGYHGPFQGLVRFSGDPDPYWRQFDNCCECNSTMHVESEQAKQAEVEARAA